MPQLMIECSEKDVIVDPKVLLLAVNNDLMASKEFRAEDIKSRLYIAEVCLVGIDMDNFERNAYVAATLKIMAGRSLETQQKMIQGLTETIQKNLNPQLAKNIEITVELLEIDAKCYQKRVVK